MRFRMQPKLVKGDFLLVFALYLQIRLCSSQIGTRLFLIYFVVSIHGALEKCIKFVAHSRIEAILWTERPKIDH